MCYGFQHHLSILEETGRPIRRVCATDGGSRSRLWMQIAADVVNRPVEIVGGEAASALGVAFVAAMGAGLFQIWDEIKRFITHGAVYQPRPAAVAQYQRGFSLYRDLYQRLWPFLPEPGELQNSYI